MAKRDTHSSLNKYTRAILEHSRKVLPGYDPDEIHDLRTSVKRLRALLSLQKDKNATRLPEPFKKVYHAAGDLRDLQVQLQQLTALPIIVPHFAVWLSSGISHAAHAWDRIYDEEIVVKLQKNIAVRKLSRISAQHLDQFFIDSFNNIGDLLKKSQTDEVLHEIRREIKTLMYVAEWAKAEWKEGWEMLKLYDIPALKELSDLAGSYNDMRIELEFLISYLKHEKDPEAFKAAKVISDQWMARKRQKGKQLISAITETVERYT